MMENRCMKFIPQQLAQQELFIIFKGKELLVY
jgi:hypothetical protein